jgi:hypothetical protein
MTPPLLLKKRYHHTMNQGFFEHHGESYHAELPLAATVPGHFPKPSLLAKVKAQPRLIAVSKAFRPAAKLMIQGQKVATAVSATLLPQSPVGQGD